MTEIKYRLDEDGEKAISLCKSCNCMTFSVDKEVCYKCSKCGETK